jgi:hypothetical protein
VGYLVVVGNLCLCQSAYSAKRGGLNLLFIQKIGHLFNDISAMIQPDQKAASLLKFPHEQFFQSPLLPTLPEYS